MDSLLATDRRFLLGNWLESAKSKATTADEKENFEWNARTQITLWGQNSTNTVSLINFFLIIDKIAGKRS
jgi:alpha-N-acetylglucosaminidase